MRISCPQPNTSSSSPRRTRGAAPAAGRPVCRSSARFDECQWQAYRPQPEELQQSRGVTPSVTEIPIIGKSIEGYASTEPRVIAYEWGIEQGGSWRYKPRAQIITATTRKAAFSRVGH